jgi:hypothetical protein
MLRYIKANGIGLTRADPMVPGSPDSAADPTLVNNIYYIKKDPTAAPGYNGTRLVLASDEDNAEVPLKMDVNYNTLTFKVEEEVYTGTLTSGGIFHGSLDEAGRDTYGSNIFFPNILPDSAFSFVEVRVLKKFDDDVDDKGSFTGYRIVDEKDDLRPNNYVARISGSRSVTAINESILATGVNPGTPDPQYLPVLMEGWQEAAKSQYSDTHIFMEPTGIEELKETMYALRSNIHKMSTYISAKKITEAESHDPKSITVTGRITGTAQYVNEFLRKDPYQGKKYWTNLIGSVGTKLAKIMEKKLGGWSPMFTDTSGLGGQLPIKVERAKFEFTPQEQKGFDEVGLNPIVLDGTYGVMIISQKTTQDPNNLSDWSYLGHQMAFDLIKREIKLGVMIPQIGKPNDGYYQDLRQRQTEAILARRIAGVTPIWAEGKVVIKPLNTDAVKAQRKFILKVVVKVNIFSEYVELIFENVGQEATVA